MQVQITQKTVVNLLLTRWRKGRLTRYIESVRTITVNVWMSAIWLLVMLESPTWREGYHDRRYRMWRRG